MENLRMKSDREKWWLECIGEALAAIQAEGGK
jgi:hypothetical protein